MKLIFKLLVASFFSIPAFAIANDSNATASAATGGLVLIKSENIEMVSEVLEISPKKVRVKYHFMNSTDQEIKTTVAFPMPIYGSDEYSSTTSSVRLKIE